LPSSTDTLNLNNFNLSAEATLTLQNNLSLTQFPRNINAFDTTSTFFPWTIAGGYQIPIDGTTTIYCEISPTTYTTRAFRISTPTITGTGKIVKTGLGMLGLGGVSGQVNTFSGGIDVNGGWISPVFDGDTLGTGPITFQNLTGNSSFGITTGASTNVYVVPNKFIIKSSVNLGFAGSSAPPITFSGEFNIPNAGEVTISVNKSHSLNGVITGPKTAIFRREGAGALGLNYNTLNASQFAGIFRFIAGTTTISDYTLQNATFDTDYQVGVTLSGDVRIGAITGGSPLTLQGTTYIGSDYANDGYHSGIQNGTGTITINKIGSNNQTFAGPGGNKTSSPINIQGGSLTYTTNNPLSTTTATLTTTISDGAQLRLYGNISTITTGPMSLGGTLRSLTVPNIATTPAFGGRITLTRGAYLTADVNSTLNIYDLRLNGQMLYITGAGSVKFNTPPTYLDTVSGLVVLGKLDVSGISTSPTYLDGTGTIIGNIGFGEGGNFISGNGSGGQTLAISGSVTAAAGISIISAGADPNTNIASKIAITGTFSALGSFGVRCTGTGWKAGVEYAIATFATSTPPSVFLALAWTDSANPRIGSGTVRSTSTAIYITPQATLANLTWNGGVSGLWYDNQNSGFTFSGGGTGFYNGDNVTFSTAQNTSTATVNGAVTVASLSILNPSSRGSQTITGSGTITNNGNLNITDSTFDAARTDPYSVFLGVAGTHGTINVRQTRQYVGTEIRSIFLYVTNANALGGTSQINLTSDFTYGDIRVLFTAGANGLTTSRNVYTFTGAPTIFDVAANTRVTFSGTITNQGVGGVSYENFRKTGAGTLVLTGLSTYDRGINFYDGTLEINNIANIGVPSALGTAPGGSPFYSGTTLKYTGPTASTNRDFTVLGFLDASGTGTLTCNGIISSSSGSAVGLTGTSTGVISTTIGGTGVGLTKQGTGTWTLSSANTHTGPNTISGGKLVISKKTGLGTGAVSLAGSLQCTDKTTDPTKIASVSSFTTTGGSARLIIGA
jgi:autotransporter-associated beta strand protein